MTAEYLDEVDKVIDANHFEPLTDTQVVEHKAKLDTLEYIVETLNTLRESYTKELIVSGVKDEDMLREKLEKIRSQIENPKE